MSYKSICFLVAVVTTLVAFPAHAINLDFYQIDWMADPAAGIGPYVSQDSDWGRVEITLTSADHSLFTPMILVDGTSGWGGFVNVVTDATGVDDWEIYNLPIFYENPLELDGRLPQGVLFDLGVGPGVDVSALNYGYSINPTPQLTTGAFPAVSTMPATVNPFEILAGGDQLYIFGSLVESGGMASPQAAMDFPGAESGEVIADRASISIPETSVAGVNEDVNGCAPGSVARSLKYMSDSHSNVNVPDSANTVYGELKTRMGTTAKGTTTPGILHGKNQYVTAHGLPITSTQTKSFKEAIETLKNKGDVEVGMHWGYGADGKSKGAHRAFVSEVQELQDANGNTTGYVVKTVDDVKQGDGNATNATHTAKFDANGNLIQYDGKGTANGARLINFQTENVHASTVVLEFPWGGSYTYHVPPGGSIPTPFGSIPVGPPGTSTTFGGIKIRFEGADSPGAMVTSELVVNPQALPEMGETLDMNLDLDLIPIDPSQPSLLHYGLNLEHVRPDESTGELLPVVSGEEELFLENLVMGGSFFDITYRVSTGEGEYEEGDEYQIFRLHGEITEEFLESVWLVGMGEVPAIPPEPDFPAESFFDVFFDLEIMPEAYELLGEFGEPGLTTLLNMQLTVTAVPELIPDDANGDGVVDVSDLGILATNYGTTSGAQWSNADFNGDGIVDVSDLGVLATNYGNTAGTAAVPEPGTLTLLVICGLTLLGLGARRRKR